MGERLTITKLDPGAAAKAPSNGVLPLAVPSQPAAKIDPSRHEPKEEGICRDQDKLRLLADELEGFAETVLMSRKSKRTVKRIVHECEANGAMEALEAWNDVIASVIRMRFGGEDIPTQSEVARRLSLSLKVSYVQSDVSKIQRDGLVQLVVILRPGDARDETAMNTTFVHPLAEELDNITAKDLKQPATRVRLKEIVWQCAEDGSLQELLLEHPDECAVLHLSFGATDLPTRAEVAARFSSEHSSGWQFTEVSIERFEINGIGWLGRILQKRMDNPQPSPDAEAVTPEKPAVDKSREETEPFDDKASIESIPPIQLLESLLNGSIHMSIDVKSVLHQIVSECIEDGSFQKIRSQDPLQARVLELRYGNRDVPPQKEVMEILLAENSVKGHVNPTFIYKLERAGLHTILKILEDSTEPIATATKCSFADAVVSQLKSNIFQTSDTNARDHTVAVAIKLAHCIPQADVMRYVSTRSSDDLEDILLVNLGALHQTIPYGFVRQMEAHNVSLILQPKIKGIYLLQGEAEALAVIGKDDQTIRKHRRRAAETLALSSLSEEERSLLLEVTAIPEKSEELPFVSRIRTILSGKNGFTESECRVAEGLALYFAAKLGPEPVISILERAVGPENLESLLEDGLTEHLVKHGTPHAPDETGLSSPSETWEHRIFNSPKLTLVAAIVDALPQYAADASHAKNLVLNAIDLNNFILSEGGQTQEASEQRLQRILEAAVDCWGWRDLEQTLHGITRVNDAGEPAIKPIDSDILARNALELTDISISITREAYHVTNMAINNSHARFRQSMDSLVAMAPDTEKAQLYATLLKGNMIEDIPLENMTEAPYNIPVRLATYEGVQDALFRMLDIAEFRDRQMRSGDRNVHRMSSVDRDAFLALTNAAVAKNDLSLLNSGAVKNITATEGSATALAGFSSHVRPPYSLMSVEEALFTVWSARFENDGVVSRGNFEYAVTVLWKHHMLDDFEKQKKGDYRVLNMVFGFDNKEMASIERVAGRLKISKDKAREKISTALTSMKQHLQKEFRKAHPDEYSFLDSVFVFDAGEKSNLAGTAARLGIREKAINKKMESALAHLRLHIAEKRANLPKPRVIRASTKRADLEDEGESDSVETAYPDATGRLSQPPAETSPIKPLSLQPRTLRPVIETKSVPVTTKVAASAQTKPADVLLLDHTDRSNRTEIIRFLKMLQKEQPDVLKNSQRRDSRSHAALLKYFGLDGTKAETADAKSVRRALRQIHAILVPDHAFINMVRPTSAPISDDDQSVFAEEDGDMPVIPELSGDVEIPEEDQESSTAGLTDRIPRRRPRKSRDTYEVIASRRLPDEEDPGRETDDATLRRPAELSGDETENLGLGRTFSPSDEEDEDGEANAIFDDEERKVASGRVGTFNSRRTTGTYSIQKSIFELPPIPDDPIAILDMIPKSIKNKNDKSLMRALLLKLRDADHLEVLKSEHPRGYLVLSIHYGLGGGVVLGYSETAVELAKQEGGEPLGRKTITGIEQTAIRKLRRHLQPDSASVGAKPFMPKIIRRPATGLVAVAPKAAALSATESVPETVSEAAAPDLSSKPASALSTEQIIAIFSSRARDYGTYSKRRAAFSQLEKEGRLDFLKANRRENYMTLKLRYSGDRNLSLAEIGVELAKIEGLQIPIDANTIHKRQKRGIFFIIEHLSGTSIGESLSQKTLTNDEIVQALSLDSKRLDNLSRKKAALLQLERQGKLKLLEDFLPSYWEILRLRYLGDKLKSNAEIAGEFRTKGRVLSSVRIGQIEREALVFLIQRLSPSNLDASSVTAKVNVMPLSPVPHLSPIPDDPVQIIGMLSLDTISEVSRLKNRHLLAKLRELGFFEKAREKDAVSCRVLEIRYLESESPVDRRTIAVKLREEGLTPNVFTVTSMRRLEMRGMATLAEVAGGKLTEKPTSENPTPFEQKAHAILDGRQDIRLDQVGRRNAIAMVQDIANEVSEDAALELLRKMKNLHSLAATKRHFLNRVRSVSAKPLSRPVLEPTPEEIVAPSGYSPFVEPIAAKPKTNPGTPTANGQLAALSLDFTKEQNIKKIQKALKPLEGSAGMKELKRENPQAHLAISLMFGINDMPQLDITIIPFELKDEYPKSRKPTERAVEKLIKDGLDYLRNSKSASK